MIRAPRTRSEDDPQPEPPACFCDPKHVAQRAETEALSVAAARPDAFPEARAQATSEPGGLVAPADWHPKRLVRTVLGSIVGSNAFGTQGAPKAKRRRFAEARARAFGGDGLPWNWSIWKPHCSTFTPILDLIHVLMLSYLFLVAKAVPEEADDAWDQYLVWKRGAWQGEVAQVLEELRVWQTKRGEPPEDAADHDPRKSLAQTITYLGNNPDRMCYPDDRREGLPVTTAWMESLVKEMNSRVQGTERFWNDPEGAEAILQVRAAALCDDERLTKHLGTRTGRLFTRRPQTRKPSVQEIRS